MRVCLLCFPPNHSVSIAPHQSQLTCEFACLPSRPTIAFCTAPYQSRQTYSLLPAQPSRLASRYTKASKLANLQVCSLSFPPNHSVLHRAIPKRRTLRVCVPSFPPNHAIWHRAKPKPATLRVCLLCSPPNHSLWHCAIPTQAGCRVCLLCLPPNQP